MDLTALQERCEDRFRDYDNDVISKARWTQHINAAYQEFNAYSRWPFRQATTTVTLTADTRRVDITEDVQAGLKNIFDSTNGRQLQPLPDDLPFHMRLYWEEKSSEPLYWSISGDALYVLPAPTTDATLEIQYFTFPTLLSAGGDVPDIPERYHESLVSGALYRAFSDDGDEEGANRYRQEFTQYLEQAARELIGETDAREDRGVRSG